MGSLDNKNIGFISVGDGGNSIAKRLHNAGANTFAYNRSPAARYEIARNGISLCNSPAEIAIKIENGVVILMMPDNDATESILEGEDSLFSKLAENTLIIDMSDTAEDRSEKFAALAKEKGAHWLKAPLSEGNLEARVNTEGETFDRARSIFRCLDS